ncbi:MAG TPA: Gfo/Idh/MocA family oxidoreductase [Candidatus Dormibacteraeota bacterium]|nr:Gfo/Idh/MocA family oxidoreductase [Candidatus Dormibacteraeota bacterium]
MITDSTITRRSFISGGAALAVTARSVVSAPRVAERRLRMALVGTGARGSFNWGQEVMEGYSDVVEIVGLCDINRKRVEAAKKLIGTNAPSFVDFDRMIKETRPDTVMVATVDATHAHYIVRALELGCDVMTEKPLCTDEKQCLSILDAQRKSGKKVTVTFNARHDPEAKKVKELLLEKAVGDVISLDFHEYLDTSHGADYFRRWHRLKENSGTLLVHKASHHFDLANWWLDSTPVEVTAFGDLKFYGRNNSFRNTHCRVCPFKQKCKFYWDVTQNQSYVKLYVDCESEDGYLRDGCVWREDINIYDTMSVVVKYENGVFLNYTANTYLPLEGQAISINGRTGRLDYNEFAGGGFGNKGLRLTPSFGKSELIQDLGARRAGGHGGADTSLRDLIFRGSQGSDPLGLRADLRAGARSSLIGIAAYRSIERGGQTVRIKDLVKL